MDITREEMLDVLEEFLPKCWSKETAYKNEWDKDNPSKNQCAVTAMIVQDIVGGVILCCPTSDGDSHFYNKFDDGSEYDLTEDQFDDKVYPMKLNAKVYDRADLENNQDTYKRYKKLSKSVGLLLLEDIMGAR